MFIWYCCTFQDETEADEIDAEKPQDCKESKGQKSFQCKKCTSVLSRKDGLKRHMLKQHGEENYTDDDINKKTVCIYPGCEAVFYHKTKLIQHVEAEHSVACESETYEFKSVEVFREWKKDVEQTNYVYFTSSSGKNTGKNAKYTYYECQRGGAVRSHRKKGEPDRLTPRRNKKGTARSGEMCPARMQVKIDNNGTTHVKYFKSHNHPIKFEDTKHHPVPPEVKEEIKAMLIMGVSDEDILKNVRGELTDRTNNDQNSPQMKKHFVSASLISRMRRQLKIKKRGRSQKGKNGGNTSSVVVENMNNVSSNSSSDSQDDGMSSAQAEDLNFQLFNPAPTTDVYESNYAANAVSIMRVQENLKKLQSYLENEHVVGFALPYMDTVLQDLVSKCDTVIEISNASPSEASSTFLNLTSFDHVEPSPKKERR